MKTRVVSAQDFQAQRQRGSDTLSSAPSGWEGATAKSSGKSAALPASLCAVQLVLAYEWLTSGIDKLVNPNFTAQLSGTLKQSLNGNPYTAYVGFIRQIVLPHSLLFGLLTELAEAAIGLTLAISAVIWLLRPRTRLAVYAGGAACLALGGAAFLSLNYFLQGGSPLPWIDPANAFNEGVDIDILIPLLSLTLLVANIRAVRATRKILDRVEAVITRGLKWAS